jgi:formamidopyrimidine-DNA glycosylase
LRHCEERSDEAIPSLAGDCFASLAMTLFQGFALRTSLSSKGPAACWMSGLLCYTVDMPELPDLEVIKEFLQDHIVGQEIAEVEVVRPIVARNLADGDFAPRLTGQRIEQVHRQGKFLILALDSGDYLVINPMLAGRLHYAPRRERRLRKTFVVLHLADGMDLRYTDAKTMGKVYLTDDLAKVPGFAELGPEALDPSLTLELFRKRLRKYRGEIKGILTTQSFVAGIGNAYADEICWRAGVYPFRKRPRLSEEEVARLYEAMHEVLNEAIAILRERVGADIHAEIRDFLQVHGRGGQSCPRCGTAISEIKARQRLTNFCRQCQPGSLIRHS